MADGNDYRNDGAHIHGPQFQGNQFHITNVPPPSLNGKKCPHCGGSPLVSTPLAWAQHPTLSPAAPPKEPMQPPRLLVEYAGPNGCATFLLGGLISLIIASSTSWFDLDRPLQDIVFWSILAVGTLLPCFVVTNATMRRNARKRAEHAEAVNAYETRRLAYQQALTRWHASWICASHCGRIVSGDAPEKGNE